MCLEREESYFYGRKKKIILINKEDDKELFS